MNIVKAVVLKVSESGKSAFFGIKLSKYSSGYDITGYAANPDGLVKDDVVEDFPMPVGVEHRSITDAAGNVTQMATKDGEPISFLKWA